VTPPIEKLLVIQDHDARLLKFERELADIPARKAAIDSLLDDHRHALAEAKEALKVRQSEVKRAELDIESARDKIRKLREQQMQLKSNREFRAMEDEITGVEKVIRGIEDKMLEMMEGVETAQAGVRAKEADLKTEADGVQRETSVIEQRAGDLRAEVQRTQESRAKLAVAIDPDLLKRYERIFNNKRDRALVAVENGSCGGCHMKLPPYICHEARKQTDVVVCEFCQRMLY
jgi:predicted  nucleic acid-binding Zn-ribbon protein